MGIRRDFKVKGMTHTPLYPSNAFRLQGMLESVRMGWWKQAWSESSEPRDGANGFDRLNGDEPTLPVSLVRDPANPVDSNAIRVYVPALGDGEAGFVGHVPAGIAKRLAPRIDEGIEFGCALIDILVAENDSDNPGIEIGVWRLKEDPAV